MRLCHAPLRGNVARSTCSMVPLDWASTQNNLGLPLWRLGERASGTAKLDEAAAAYRATVG